MLNNQQKSPKRPSPPPMEEEAMMEHNFDNKNDLMEEKKLTVNMFGKEKLLVDETVNEYINEYNTS